MKKKYSTVLLALLLFTVTGLVLVYNMNVITDENSLSLSELKTGKSENQLISSYAVSCMENLETVPTVTVTAFPPETEIETNTETKAAMSEISFEDPVWAVYSADEVTVSEAMTPITSAQSE